MELISSTLNIPQAPDRSQIILCCNSSLRHQPTQGFASQLPLDSKTCLSYCKHYSSHSTGLLCPSHKSPSSSSYVLEGAAPSLFLLVGVLVELAVIQGWSSTSFRGRRWKGLCFRSLEIKSLAPSVINGGNLNST